MTILYSEKHILIIGLSNGRCSVVAKTLRGKFIVKQIVKDNKKLYNKSKEKK